MNGKLNENLSPHRCHQPRFDFTDIISWIEPTHKFQFSTDQGPVSDNARNMREINQICEGTSSHERCWTGRCKNNLKSRYNDPSNSNMYRISLENSSQFCLRSKMWWSADIVSMRIVSSKTSDRSSWKLAMLCSRIPHLGYWNFSCYPSCHSGWLNT